MATHQSKVRSKFGITTYDVRISLQHPGDKSRFDDFQSGIAPNNATSEWLRSAMPGTCTRKVRDEAGCSQHATSGSWTLNYPKETNDRHSWWDAASRCLERCFKCPRCRFLTVSVHRGTCHWHQKCDVHALHPRPVDPDRRNIIAADLTAAVRPLGSPFKCVGHFPASRLPCSSNPASCRELVEEDYSGQCKDVDCEGGIRIDEACMQCGCSRRFPADQEAFARRVAHLVASSTRVSSSLLANLPWGIAPRSVSHTDASIRDARLPLVPHRLLADMRNQWIVMIGDSTQRMIYDQFNAMLDTYGASCLTILPHVNGNPVLNRDSQKDTDTVCLHPTLPSNRTAAPPFCRAALDWTNPRWPGTRVSMRFLRGLDLGKLELNARDWAQRAHYIEWLERSKWHPASVLFGSDPADAHPVSRAHFVRRNESGPTVVLLHSCAWDTPMINRSRSYYMGMENCPKLPARIDVKTRTSHGIERRPAPVLQTPCRKRGHASMPDEKIYAEYRRSLGYAIQLVRRSFGGRLILRNCHAGTRERGKKVQPQYEAMKRFNVIIDQVALEHCVEVLDASALDEMAGFAQHSFSENFHVPRPMSLSAAVAFMLLLRLGGNETRREPPCTACASPRQDLAC